MGKEPRMSALSVTTQPYPARVKENTGSGNSNRLFLLGEWPVCGPGSWPKVWASLKPLVAWTTSTGDFPPQELLAPSLFISTKTGYWEEWWRTASYLFRISPWGWKSYTGRLCSFTRSQTEWKIKCEISQQWNRQTKREMDGWWKSKRLGNYGGSTFFQLFCSSWFCSWIQCQWS